MNIRTVASLTKEQKFLDEYKYLISIPDKYVLFRSVSEDCTICEAMSMKLSAFVDIEYPSSVYCVLCSY